MSSLTVTNNRVSGKVTITGGKSNGVELYKFYQEKLAEIDRDYHQHPTMLQSKDEIGFSPEQDAERSSWDAYANYHAG